MLDFPFNSPSLPPERSLAEEALSFFIDALEDDIKPKVSRKPDMSFGDFIPWGWKLAWPSETFRNNWHIGYIAEHLQGVSVGHIENLLINEPPGCMKSREVSVLWPAWEWSYEAWRRYLCASFDNQLTIRDSRDVRDLITTEEYQARYPHVRLKKDQNQKTRFDTTDGGWRIATSVGGRATGEHPHRKIIDDPHSAKKAESEKDRLNVLNWRKRTLSRRGAALKAATVVIMQRLHQADMSGDILEENLQEATKDKWVHIMLPMRYDPKRSTVTVGSAKAIKTTSDDGRTVITFSAPQQARDPRTDDGELLWPELFPPDKATDPDAYVDAGQMQQQPAPEGGILFDLTKLEIVETMPAEDQVRLRARGWDGAASDEPNKGDWTAGVRLSITYGGTVYIEDVVREKVGPGDDETLMRTIAMMDPRGTRHREEQEPGSAGKKVIASHGKALHGFDYEGAPSTGSKVVRARPLASQMKLGNVKVVKGAWNKAYIDELRLFPNGTFDDQVDGSSNAYNDIALDTDSIEVVKTNFR
jgi:predicted phage terminase large subunit-like protein